MPAMTMMPMTISHSRRPISINALTSEFDDKDATNGHLEPLQAHRKNCALS
jgi:hypothetical protein